MAFSGKYVACPRCREEGKDSTGNHLSLFSDGKAGWCARFHGLVKLEGDREERVREAKPIDLALIQRYPIAALEDRGISKETAEKYGVRVSVDEQTGDVDAHYYPYTCVEGNVTGYKKRSLPKQFSVIGKVRGLFGQHLCKGGKFLCIFEGELDAMAAAEMLALSGKSFNCVSIPHGANEDGKPDQTLLRELEWMTKFEGVAICFDQDGPGQATALALADVLASQTKVKIVKLPHKDAGEMHKRGMYREFLKALYDAKAYHPEQIVEGHSLDLDKLRTAKPPGFELPYPKLNRMLHGLRKGEITLVTAGSGIGKSVWTREVAYHLALNGFKIAVIALETPMEDAARMFVAMDNNVPPYKLIFNPNCISKDDYEQSFNKLFKTDQINFFSHWGSIAADDLIRKCQYYVKALGVDFIILDHVSMTVAGSGSDNERKDIDVLFENMTRLVVETGVGMLAVMHLKRVQNKSFNKGGEVELTDLRGSSGAEAMSWTVLALERDQHGEKKDLVKLRVLKNRTVGFTGPADTLLYNHETGRLELFEAEDYD